MTLLEEFQSGSLASTIAPFIADGNDGAIVELFNNKNIFVYGKVPWQKFMDWLVKHNLLGTIYDLSINASSPFRSSAMALYHIATSGIDGPDFSKEQNITLMDAWVGSNIISLSQKEELLQLSNIKISYAEKLNLADSSFPSSLTTEMVAQTLRPGV